MISKLFAFMLCGASLYAQGGLGYGGPSVASRGLQQAGSRGSEPVNIRPFFEVHGTFDQGLIAATPTDVGGVSDSGAFYGMDASFGAYGTRTWRRTRLGLDYSGGYHHSPAKTSFNGTEHFLGLDIAQQLSRRTGFTLKAAGGTSSRAFGGTSAIAAANDPYFLGVPTSEVFDNRTYFLDATGMFIFQFGPRNSISLGGGAFGVRRSSPLLIGLNGLRASADFTRRISRTFSLGFAYQYFHSDYPRAYGEADVHSGSLQLGKSFGRGWQVSVGAGYTRFDFAGVRSSTLDPLIAEILGYSSSREAFNTIGAYPTGTLQISYRARKSALSATYSRLANPGNGLLLLNRSENTTFNYSHYTGRRITLSGHGRYVTSAGAGAYAGNMRNYEFGGAMYIKLYEDMSFNVSISERHIDTRGTQFSRWGTHMSAGFSYNPGSFFVSPR